MATTYKITATTAADGTYYLDLPISGKITSVNFIGALTAGAGGIGIAGLELSRVAVNQFIVNNPRGVIAGAIMVTSAASTGAGVNNAAFPNEPVKSGERLYLNAAYGSNSASVFGTAFVTIE